MKKCGSVIFYREIKVKVGVFFIFISVEKLKEVVKEFGLLRFELFECIVRGDFVVLREAVQIIVNLNNQLVLVNNVLGKNEFFESGIDVVIILELLNEFVEV